MIKVRSEIRDPIHTFIRVTDDERKVIDSPPVQRLRHIHQLALTSLVYPGATHRRFEHSLGVMELAGRVFDVVTDTGNREGIPGELRGRIEDEDTRRTWRRNLRMAALCHDVGHLPFSHAAEDELLPEGWDHERLTVGLIRGPSMERLWQEGLQSPFRSKEIAKLAVGEKHFKDDPLDLWESVLCEIITGDAFGVDRMDHLLRDSLHTGVAYGRFDHYRLIDTLRVLPRPAESEEGEPGEPLLGIERGGLESAEALLMARYFMYSQVYFHRVRRIYDIHLKDFLKAFLAEQLPGALFPIDPAEHLNWTDAEITACFLRAARDPVAAGHDPARRIVERTPFKLLWERTPADVERNPNVGEVLIREAAAEFGPDALRRAFYSPESASIDFPVMQRDGTVASARSLSEVLDHLPAAAFDFVFIQPELADQAKKWLENNRERILRLVPSEGEE